MSHIIVTGGSGFLGKHLCRSLLQNGHTVLNIDIKESEVCPTELANITDAAPMEKLLVNADAVFHLASLIEAGESVLYPQRFVDINISGMVTVLEAMRINGCNTLLFSSSAAIYGDPIRTPIQEDDRTIPVNPYGMTKLAMEGLLSSYVKSFGFTGVALRYFNLYGPEEHHEPETHAIPRFIEQIWRNQPVTVYGDGSHVRDFIYISDAVDAHLVALQYALEHKEQYHYFNISSGLGESVSNLIAQLGQAIGQEPQLNHMAERAGDPKILVADPSKAASVLNWHTQVSLANGLRQTVDYFLGKDPQ